MKVHNIITDKMIYGGNCLAKINGKTVFVVGALPGEQIQIQITGEKKDYIEAETVQILKASPYRRTAPCKIFGICGGCSLQYIEDSFQTQLRRDMLANIFNRAGITLPAAEMKNITCKSGSAWEYRSRFQFHDGGLISRSHTERILLDDCPVAVPEIQAYLHNTPSEVRPRGRVCMFADRRLQTDIPGKMVIGKEIHSDANNKPVMRRGKAIPNKVRRRFSGTLAEPQYRCTVQLQTEIEGMTVSKNISFDVRGFFQSNLELLEQTITEVCSLAHGNHILDMYCGCGTFSAFLAHRFAHVTMVEHNRDALAYAEENMCGIPHSSFGVSGAKWVQEYAASCEKEHGVFDTVFIDPPRSGIEAEVIQWLSKAKPAVIISLSCDPATHARDCARLLQAGYTLAKLELLDFYPQTSHIESLAVLHLT